MADIPGKAIESFGTTGGLPGLVILLLVGFIAWYIHSSRKHHTGKDEREAEERTKRDTALAEERRQWRESLDRNTAAFYELSRSLYAKPCLRPPESRPGDTDMVHR